MGHVVYAAWSTGATDLELDLLSGVAAPSALLVAPVRDSLASYVRWFPDLVRRSNSTLQFVKEARLSVTVDPTTRRPHGGSRFVESPFTCTVRIVDDLPHFRLMVSGEDPSGENDAVVAALIESPDESSAAKVAGTRLKCTGFRRILI